MLIYKKPVPYMFLCSHLNVFTTELFSTMTKIYSASLFRGCMINILLFYYLTVFNRALLI